MPSTSECPGLSRLNKLFSDIAPKGGRFIPYNYNSDEESMECYTLLGVYRSARKLLEGLAKRRTPEIKVCLTTYLRSYISTYSILECRATYFFCLS